MPVRLSFKLESWVRLNPKNAERIKISKYRPSIMDVVTPRRRRQEVSDNGAVSVNYNVSNDMNDVSVLYLSHLKWKCSNISTVTNAVELPATKHEYILTSSQALKFHIMLFKRSLIWRYDIVFVMLMEQYKSDVGSCFDHDFDDSRWISPIWQNGRI